LCVYIYIYTNPATSLGSRHVGLHYMARGSTAAWGRRVQIAPIPTPRHSTQKLHQLPPLPRSFPSLEGYLSLRLSLLSLSRSSAREGYGERAWSDDGRRPVAPEAAAGKVPAGPSARSLRREFRNRNRAAPLSAGTTGEQQRRRQGAAALLLLQCGRVRAGRAHAAPAARRLLRPGQGRRHLLLRDLRR
jgi:hypothetical protein